jgi:Na+/proline symporter
MLLAVIVSIVIINRRLNFDIGTLISRVWHSNMSDIIITDITSRQHYIKQFLSGMFITITMTGLDQEMMQKNLSCRNLKEAQTNMFTFSFTLIFVNLMFLFLGAVLLIYAQSNAVAFSHTDELFPKIAMQQLGPIAGLVFLIGLISAAYPSADGALTSLTTIFCIDFLNFEKKTNVPEKQKIRTRYAVHLSIAAVFIGVIVIFKLFFNDKAIIDKLFTIAGYTYGPLLGFYSFGLFTKFKVRDRFVPYIAVASPLICYVLSIYSPVLLNGYKFGFELLILNGLLTFFGLYFIRKKS